MPVHFPSEASPSAEIAHGRSKGRALDSVHLGFHFSRRETGAGHDFTGLTAAVQLRHRVASGLQTLISEVPALNRRELGANPRRPTISASVVKSQSSSASNGEFAGGSPAGCTSFNAALAQLPEALRSERRGWGWNSLTRHHFAHVVQCRDGAFKTRTVSVQIRPWAPSACSPMQRRSAQTGKVAGASPAASTNFGLQALK